jgi:transglutaminase-like putative cysteine protease
MRLAIRHITTYEYDSPVIRLAQLIRLCPVSNAAQQVIDWHVRGNDGRSLVGVRDGFGNITHSHSVNMEVTKIEIRVEGVIETQDSNGLVSGTYEPLPSLFYLASTDYTRSDEAISALADAARQSTPLETMHSLMRIVRDRIDYMVDTTDVTQNAAQALALGTGVCQDHAHVMCAAARWLGLPSRYVSGYLWNPEMSDDVASHAWMEAYIEGLGWTGFDAANRQCPTDAYVRLAVGRDYADAAPVRGVRVGGKSEAMTVQVQVQATSQQ